MTRKELNYKLAKDIARIKMMVNKSYWTGTPGRTIAEAMVEVISNMDAGEKETKLLQEMVDIYKDEKSLEAVQQYLTAPYLKMIIQKLKLRAKKFETKDRKEKENSWDPRDVEKARTECVQAVLKVTKLVETAIARGKDQVVVPVSVVEDYNYNIEQARWHIASGLKQLNIISSTDDIEIEFTPYKKRGASEENSGVLEHLEKVIFYGKWIYEKYQPTGVVQIKIKKST